MAFVFVLAPWENGQSFNTADFVVDRPMSASGTYSIQRFQDATCGGSSGASALRVWLSRVNRDEYTEARELRLALFDDGAAREWTQIKDEEVFRHTQNARALLTS